MNWIELNWIQFNSIELNWIQSTWRCLASCMPPDHGRHAWRCLASCMPPDMHGRHACTHARGHSSSGQVACTRAFVVRTGGMHEGIRRQVACTRAFVVRTGGMHEGIRRQVACTRAFVVRTGGMHEGIRRQDRWHARGHSSSGGMHEGIRRQDRWHARGHSSSGGMHEGIRRQVAWTVAFVVGVVSIRISYWCVDATFVSHQQVIWHTCTSIILDWRVVYNYKTQDGWIGAWLKSNHFWDTAVISRLSLSFSSLSLSFSLGTYSIILFNIIHRSLEIDLEEWLINWNKSLAARLDIKYLTMQTNRQPCSTCSYVIYLICNCKTATS